MFSPSFPHPLSVAALRPQSPVHPYPGLPSPSRPVFERCYVFCKPLQTRHLGLSSALPPTVTEPVANSRLCKQKLSLGKSLSHFFNYSHDIISRCNPCPKQFTALLTLHHLIREKEASERARRKAPDPSTFPFPAVRSSDTSSWQPRGETKPPRHPRGAPRGCEVGYPPLTEGLTAPSLPAAPARGGPGSPPGAASGRGAGRGSCRHFEASEIDVEIWHPVLDQSGRAFHLPSPPPPIGRRLWAESPPRPMGSQLCHLVNDAAVQGRLSHVSWKAANMETRREQGKQLSNAKMMTFNP